MTLLVVLGAVGGSLVGFLDAQLSRGVRPLALGLGLSVLIGGIVALANRWVLRPFESLAQGLEGVLRHRNPHSAEALRGLPTMREDETGRIARLVHQFGTLAARHQIEASHLRRTLDHRIAEATANATKKLRRIVMRDPLTDLGNRRFLDENLQPLVETVRASGADLVCVLLDMDNFKQINDAHGHAVGDEILIFLAGLIRATTRREDYSVRLGGDEFCILMPDCSLDRTAEFTHRLQSLFTQHVRTAFSGENQPGLSIGVASLVRDRLSTGRELVERADANLYTAKAKGKGCVVGV